MSLCSEAADAGRNATVCACLDTVGDLRADPKTTHLCKDFQLRDKGIQLPAACTISLLTAIIPTVDGVYRSKLQYDCCNPAAIYQSANAGNRHIYVYPPSDITTLSRFVTPPSIEIAPSYSPFWPASFPPPT